MKLTTWHEIAEELNGDSKLKGLSDEQVKAMIEALALTIHADDKVAPLEVAGFNHLLFDLPWLEAKHELMRDHIPTAAQKARAAHEEPAGTGLARDISQRLADGYLREKVFVMAASLAQVDAKLVSAENEALTWLAEAFGIDDERRREIEEHIQR